MAGPFAHVILVDTLCLDGDVLDSIQTLTNPMRYALMEFDRPDGQQGI